MGTALGWQQATTADLNGQPTMVQQMHRRCWIRDGAGTGEYEPVALTVLAPVALSLDDAAAVLFGWAVGDEELADDTSVRELVADTVINEGGQRIEELRCQITGGLDAEQRALLAACRHRAAEVFTGRPRE
jgi:hypothetical protein